MPDLDVIRSLMRLDYMLQHRHKPRTLWWTSPSKTEVGAWLKRLADAPEQLHAGFGSLELTEQALHKHAMVDLWHVMLCAWWRREKRIVPSRAP